MGNADGIGFQRSGCRFDMRLDMADAASPQFHTSPGNGQHHLLGHVPDKIILHGRRMAQLYRHPIAANSVLRIATLFPASAFGHSYSFQLTTCSKSWSIPSPVKEERRRICARSFSSLILRSVSSMAASSTASTLLMATMSASLI